MNEAMARAYWPGESAIGKRFKLGDPDDKEVPWVTIVGIARDVRNMGVDEPVKRRCTSYQQGSEPFYTPRDLVIRTRRAFSMVAAATTRFIKSIPINRLEYSHDAASLAKRQPGKSWA